MQHNLELLVVLHNWELEGKQALLAVLVLQELRGNMEHLGKKENKEKELIVVQEVGNL